MAAGSLILREGIQHESRVLAKPRDAHLGVIILGGTLHDLKIRDTLFGGQRGVGTKSHDPGSLDAAQDDQALSLVFVRTE